MLEKTIPTKNIICDCPSCGIQSTFKFIGEQKWSEAVAKKLGIPTIIHLYNCDTCRTTLTGTQLTR